MNTTQRQMIRIVLILALMLVPTAIIAAKELGALTITGPNIKGELRLDDPSDITKLDRSGFFESGKKIDAPQGLGEGYTIVRYLYMEEGLIPWDKMIYYPDPAGGPGSMYFAGGVDQTLEGYVTGWYQTRAGGEEAFESILTAHGVSIAVDAPAPQPVSVEEVAAPVQAPAVADTVAPTAASTPAASPDIAPMFGIGLAALVVAGLAIGRWLSTQRRQSTKPLIANK